MVGRALQAEYDQLLLTHRDPSVHRDMKSFQNNAAAADAELIAEAKQLSKHKTQLEVRMRILEEHNRQLDAQLQRLRLLLDQVMSALSTPCRFKEITNCNVYYFSFILAL